MTPHAASVLALLAVAAAIDCPDEAWLKLNDKCYSKQAHGTHAECATICGANASLVHITSKLENDFARFVVDGDVWIGLYKLMHPLHPHMKSISLRNASPWFSFIDMSCVSLPLTFLCIQ